VGLGTEVNVGRPEQGLSWGGLAQAGDGVVQGVRGPGRQWLVIGLWVAGVGVEQIGICGVGHMGGDGVRDAPQGGQNVPVAGQLQICGLPSRHDDTNAR
jgi:hypothetical protein